jgi:hypothetical protein
MLASLLVGVMLHLCWDGGDSGAGPVSGLCGAQRIGKLETPSMLLSQAASYRVDAGRLMLFDAVGALNSVSKRGAQRVAWRLMSSDNTLASSRGVS